MVSAGTGHPGMSVPPAARWVLLGASNLTHGLAIVLATVRQRCPAPLDVLAAEGNGRSYGKTSRVLWRELPGIVQCGLWQALAQRPSAPTSALLTDIGNDILYDVPVDQITQWVDECLTRLTDTGAHVAMTELPIDNLQALSRRRFLFFRRLFVPQCRLALETVCGRAHELNAALSATAQRRGVALVPQSAAWYGLDPMHIRATLATRAWQTILAPVLPATASPPQIRRRGGEQWRLLKLRPKQRRMWGKEQLAVQPAMQFTDGMTLSLY